MSTEKVHFQMEMFGIADRSVNGRIEGQKVQNSSLDKGRVKVNEALEAEDWPGVWALGDCASVPDATTGKPCPPTAQHAIRQGKVLARNIVADIDGKAKQSFRFKTMGLLAAIGRRAGVANILGMQFSGFIAWFLWRSIYLAKLPRLEKKTRVAIDWTLDLFFSKDLVQFQTGRSATVNEPMAKGAAHGE